MLYIYIYNLLRHKNNVLCSLLLTEPQLIGNLPVQRQYNFDVKPYILHLRYCRGAMQTLMKRDVFECDTLSYNYNFIGK